MNPLETALDIHAQMSHPLWAALAVLLPLLAAILIFIFGRRSGPLLAVAAMIGILVSVSKLVVLVWMKGAQEYAIGGWIAPLGIGWYADGLSVLMLSMTAIVGSFITLYALKSKFLLTPLLQKENLPAVSDSEQEVKLLPLLEKLPHEASSEESKSAHEASSVENLKYPLVPVPDEKSTLPVPVEASNKEAGTSNSPLPFDKARIWPLWLLLWSGLNALFLSADLFNWFISLEIITLAAVPLIILSGGANALGAGLRYLLVALSASLLYLLGVVLLYGAVGTLNVNLLALEIKSGPTSWMAMFLIILGLLTKMAVFPLHVWLPPTLFRAPAVVSALLSALVIKAAFYLLLRFWFEVFPTDLLPQSSQILGVLGAIAMIWGAWQALQQSRLKMLVAYSVVAQIGFLLLLFPLASSGTTWSLTAWKGGIYFALSHAFAIAAMFMVAGNIWQVLGTDSLDSLRGLGRHYPSSLITFALAGVSIVGLPPSGGFLGNWLLFSVAWKIGQWWWIGIMVIGSLLAAAYIVKVLKPAFEKTDKCVLVAQTPLLMKLVPLVLALIALVSGLVATQPLSLLEKGSPF
jgi:multicomponent Na+:H+ antiporter subunit D